MKLANFDFRIWDNREQCYLNENYLENSPFQAMGLVKAHKSSFFGHNFDKVALFSAGEDKECGFGWNSGDDDDSYELELWSGIRDKNGKKIYEGDIIKISPKEAYIKQRLKENPFYLKGATLLVEFHIKDTFGFCFWGNEEKTGKALHPLDFWQKLYHYKEFGEDFEIEILGNIHENADLLNARILKDKE